MDPNFLVQKYQNSNIFNLEGYFINNQRKTRREPQEARRKLSRQLEFLATEEK